MIALLGGRYDGKYLVREKMPKGTRIGIVAPRSLEVYTVDESGGVAEVCDPYLPMDDAALEKYVVNQE